MENVSSNPLTEQEAYGSMATQLAMGKCVLFCGAGLNCDTGGATWDQLVAHLATVLGYESPLLGGDALVVLDDMVRTYGRTRVHDLVLAKLKGATLDSDTALLASLPWFGVFTTNYDTALDVALREAQSRTVKTVLHSTDYGVPGIPGELQLVKLMGSLTEAPGLDGSIVLTEGDLVRAKVQRTRLMDRLCDHAALLSFLFVGYSFRDGLVMETLTKLQETLQQPAGRFFALFRTPPNAQLEYRLKQKGVHILIGDRRVFAKRLVEETNLRNPADLSRCKLLLGEDIVPVEGKYAPRFMELHDPITLAGMQGSTEPGRFFKGDTGSLHPFVLQWHYYRPEMGKAVALASEAHGPLILRFVGSIGSGKTFAMLASVAELVRKHRALALRIRRTSLVPIPDPDDLTGFYFAVETATEEVGCSGPNMVVLCADFELDAENLARFRRLASIVKSRVGNVRFVLLHESDKCGTPESAFVPEEQADVRMDAILPLSMRSLFAQYLVQTARRHRFPEISEQDACQLIATEGSFLPIVYLLMESARHSVNDTIETRLATLHDDLAQEMVFLCSMASSLGLTTPISVLRKTIGHLRNRSMPYESTLRLALEVADAFLMISEDIRSDIYVGVFHELVARRICDIVGKEKADALLLAVAESTDPFDLVEAGFANALFLARGVNRPAREGSPFSEAGLLAALSTLRSRAPARPVLHHLARLHSFRGEYDEAIRLLRQALAEPPEPYVLTESVSYVQTSLAHQLWTSGRASLLHAPLSDPAIREITDLLDTAERRQSGPAPFDVHVNVLWELASSRVGDEKLRLLTQALEVVREGYEACFRDPEGKRSLQKREAQVLGAIDPSEALQLADTLLQQEKDGIGYYALAQLAFSTQDTAVADSYLTKALTGTKPLPRAMALRLRIELGKASPDYSLTARLADSYRATLRGRSSWMEAFNNAVAYTAVGRYSDAQREFAISNANAPEQMDLPVREFIQEGGHRKPFVGLIGRPLHQRAGRVRATSIPDWPDGFHFDPRVQRERRQMLRPGLEVEFEIGFTLRGPVAFDVRPKGYRMKDFGTRT